MVFGAFKSMFGGSEPEPPKATSAAGPCGLSLGRAVTLDTMRLRIDEKLLARGVPTETVIITGHGVANLDGTALIHRYYDDANTMLQILCEGGGTGDESIREITLYHPWDEVVPTTSAEWDGWVAHGGRIGQAKFEADGLSFDRVWGEPGTAWVAPAEFTETITVDDGSARTIHQRIMPYRREIGDTVETLLIAVERDIASSDPGSVTFMIGYGLSLADVTAV